MNRPPKASLIIAFYQKTDWLEMILEALRFQTEPSFEVVIADDGSSTEVTERIRSIIPQYPFPIIHSWHSDEGWRKNRALNKAVVASESNYLIFIDGDCIPDRHFIEEHLSYRQQGAVLAGRRVELPLSISEGLNKTKAANHRYWSRSIPQLLWAGIRGKQRHTEECIRITNKWLRKTFLKDRKAGLLGCNFSIYKSDLLKINGYDERFTQPFLGEDTDIEARLQRVGVGVRVMRHALTVYHRNHKRATGTSDLSYRLYTENNQNSVGYTPYGIVRDTNSEDI